MNIKQIKQTEKKDLIIRAALEIFCEKGFHDAKMEEIADRANIGKGTIYEYFRSKETLFEKSIHAGIDYLDKIVMEDAMSKPTAREQVEAIIRGNVKILFQFKRMAKLVSLDMISRLNMEKFKEYKQKNLSRFKARLKGVMEIIQKGIDQGEFRKVDQMTAASIIYSSVIGLAHRILFCSQETEETDDSAADSETVIDETVRLIMNGLSKEP